jgi:CRISPR/Cas system CSM-associated protein Csm3 (group 7 of RAMP superfamily)
MNTSTATITIELLSYWHIGSGQSRGGEADALVLKDVHGLPYVPGRTLKGLFREAVQTLEDLSEKENVLADITQKLFGGSAKEGAERGAKEGQLIFEDARLPEDVHAWLAQKVNTSQRLQLFDLFSQTALTEGQAKDKALRMIEVCVPIKLKAKVATEQDTQNWFPILERAAGLIRSLGSHRRRGLGRCKVIVMSTGDTQ